MGSSQETTTELCRKNLTITKSEETFCEWCNSYIAIRTHKGIYFYELSHNLESVDKQLDCIESFLSTPTSSPSESIFDCDLVRLKLKNKDMAEMMLDPAMWGHSEHLINEMPSVIQFSFSPTGVIAQKGCVLAVLNNIGCVQMYIKGRVEWNLIVDISSCVRDQFDGILEEEAKTFDDLKKKAHILATSSICWASNTKSDNCYFVTCQKSGVLLFWSIQRQAEKITSKYCGKIELVFDEIIHTKWISKSENKFILLCSSISGQVMALECQINKKHVILLKTHILWPHKDRMVTKCSEYQIDGDQILIFYNKHRHLVTQLIDESCKIISQSVDNINDYRITSITKNNDVYVTTINFCLYRLNYCIKNNEVRVKFNVIEIKDITPTMELYGIQFSKNGVMCALAALDRRVLHKKEPLQMQTIYVRIVPEDTPSLILLTNPTKLITNYWDCIEILRLKLTKQRKLPSIDFKALLSEGETDVYKLKLYLIILRIYTSLVQNVKIANNCLPENSIEFIKDKILKMQAESNIKKLNSKKVSAKSFNPFEMECYAGSKKYLLYYCKKYKTTLTDLNTPDMLDIDEYNYTCQCCDEPIQEFSCKNGHLNIFCSLTFTAIEDFEYISCKYCNVMARIETYSENPLCVFCDSHLEISQEDVD